MSETKTAWHPIGISITLDEYTHIYKDLNGKKYESATTFIGKFFEKFDMNKMSIKCSEGDSPLYKGRDPEEIKAEWKANGDRSRNEGLNVHLYAEGVSCGWAEKDLPKPISERCEKLFKQVDLAITDLNKYYEFVAAEMILFSPELGKAGMLDDLRYSRKSNELVIFDWKQNAEITIDNKYQKGCYPIEYLEETAITKYSLQLSLYDYLIERENYFPGIKGVKRGLIHLSENKYEIIPLECHKFQIKEMLESEK